jgi:hypothetical protein
VNSEELELSLRTEFENYLKSVLADMQQELAQFQTKLQDEIERHRSHVDEAFRSFTAHAETGTGSNDAFMASVGEHLRLARDEGARITAEAFAEAEKLEKEATPSSTGYDVLRDAVNDISSQTSQSGILKSLVQHAADFAPRGIFFILRNEHLAGWKVFGADDSAENSVRDLNFPVTADTLLARAVRSLEAVQGTSGSHADDGIYLQRLGFGQPDKMYALPLVARGKAVAVLYTDHGDDATSVNREGLETLLKVASLTVELQAAASPAAASAPAASGAPQAVVPAVQPETEAAPSYSFSNTVETPHEAAASYTDAFSETVEQSTPVAESRFDFSAPERVPEPEPAPSYYADPQPQYTPAVEPPSNTRGSMVFDSPTGSEPEYGDRSHFSSSPASDVGRSRDDFAVDATGRQPADQSPFGPVTQADYAAISSGVSAMEPEVAYTPQRQPQYVPEPVSPQVENGIEPIRPAASAPATPSRLSDRPVDLPIDVPENERRLHNDARRFARLLVSEIKLYNEKKVQEGRQTHDLYERLKEAIDRSREMYDKRVQPPVAAKFDYFHYELVNSLAEGNAERLGPGYPGATV